MVSPLARGRGASPIRTPILIRDYFTGEGAFSEDPPEELAERASEGAFVAQIHQRIKRYLREVHPKYQWPRRHSFAARINDLLMLGRRVETGRREDPQQRGAGRLGTSRGFSERVWVRLAPGAAGRPEWADPLGYLIILKQTQDPSSYQNIRVPGRMLSTVARPRPRHPRAFPRNSREVSRAGGGYCRGSTPRDSQEAPRAFPRSSREVWRAGGAASGPLETFGDPVSGWHQRRRLREAGRTEWADPLGYLIILK